jgi:type I restriction enzyme R subunit
LLNYVAQGGTDADALTTLAARIARLQRDFSADQLAELKELAGGKSFADLAHDLLNACDPDTQAEAARALPGVVGEPNEAQVMQAAEQLARQVVSPFLKAQFRRRILEIRAQNEQTIDRHTIDDVLYAGFDAAAVEKAAARVKDFRAWIEEHKDELTGLQILYAGTRPLKLSLRELRQLRDALARPPLAATPAQLWRAFQAVDAEKVKGSGGELMTDLVALVRHALLPAMTLVPYRDELRERYGQCSRTATPRMPSRRSSANGSTAWPNTSPPASRSRRKISRPAGSASGAASARARALRRQAQATDDRIE